MLEVRGIQLGRYNISNINSIRPDGKINWDPTMSLFDAEIVHPYQSSLLCPAAQALVRQPSQGVNFLTQELSHGSKRAAIESAAEDKGDNNVPEAKRLKTGLASDSAQMDQSDDNANNSGPWPMDQDEDPQADLLEDGRDEEASGPGPANEEKELGRDDADKEFDELDSDVEGLAELGGKESGPGLADVEKELGRDNADEEIDELDSDIADSEGRGGKPSESGHMDIEKELGEAVDAAIIRRSERLGDKQTPANSTGGSSMGAATGSSKTGAGGGTSKTGAAGAGGTSKTGAGGGTSKTRESTASVTNLSHGKGVAPIKAYNKANRTAVLKEIQTVKLEDAEVRSNF